jgi:hypothetical protein
LPKVAALKREPVGVLNGVPKGFFSRPRQQGSGIHGRNLQAVKTGAAFGSTLQKPKGGRVSHQRVTQRPQGQFLLGQNTCHAVRSCSCFADLGTRGFSDVAGHNPFTERGLGHHEVSQRNQRE